MELRKTISSSLLRPNYFTERIYLRLPQISDFENWRNLRSNSRDFLEPWEPIWSSIALTRLGYIRRLRRYTREIRADRSITFFIFNQKNNDLLGGISLSNIRRGVTQSCTLGYWIGKPYTRLGYMSEAVNVVSHYVFESLKLNRLEAACIPSNKASIGVLKKNGFTEEGFARRYLYINGKWQDHILFAIISSDKRPRSNIIKKT